MRFFLLTWVTAMVLVEGLSAKEMQGSWTGRRGNDKTAASVLGITYRAKTPGLAAKGYLGELDSFTDIAMLGGKKVRFAAISGRIYSTGDRSTARQYLKFAGSTIYSSKSTFFHDGGVYSAVPDFVKTRKLNGGRRFMVGPVKVDATPVASVIFHSIFSWVPGDAEFARGSRLDQEIECTGRVKVISNDDSAKSKGSVLLAYCSSSLDHSWDDELLPDIASDIVSVFHGDIAGGIKLLTGSPGKIHERKVLSFGTSTGTFKYLLYERTRSTAPDSTDQSR